MILVDTTVWIGLFRDRDTAAVRHLTDLIEKGDDICTCGVIVSDTDYDTIATLGKLKTV